jgi:type II secretory pathway component PulF
MLFSSSKCPLPALVEWCRTLNHSIGAGLDPIRIFRQQGKSGPRALRPLAKELAEKLAKGTSLEDTLEPHRNRFPPLFVELVAVGEQSGRLEDTFRELSEYYETTLSVQRSFRSQMAYPAIQFIAAVLIISALIFILSLLGSKMDPTGLGITGAFGAFMFMGVSFGLVGGALLAFKLSADNVKWRTTMEGILLYLPGWGPALLNFALHRFCIALRMTTEAAMRAEKVLHYSFRATANGAFMRGEERAIAVAKKGGEVHEAIAASGAPFPEEFCHMVLVAEEAGEMSEVMERLAKNYMEEAARRLKDAAQYTGWAIYGLVAMLIIFAIFSIANQAFQPYRDAGL